RIEDIAEQARKSLQHHFPQRKVHTARRQLLAYPRQQRTTVARAVIAFMKSENRAAIDAEQAAPAPARLHLRQGHAQKGDGIDEAMQRDGAATVHDAPLAPMDGGVSLRPGAHATSMPTSCC